MHSAWPALGTALPVHAPFIFHPLLSVSLTSPSPSSSTSLSSLLEPLLV